MNSIANVEQVSIADQIKRLVVQELGLDIDPSELGDRDLLFGGQLGFDSLVALSIVVALEIEFGIIVSDEDMGVELFESVQSLADYVRSQL